MEGDLGKGPGGAEVRQHLVHPHSGGASRDVDPVPKAEEFRRLHASLVSLINTPPLVCVSPSESYPPSRPSPFIFVFPSPSPHPSHSFPP